MYINLYYYKFKITNKLKMNLYKLIKKKNNY